MGQFITSFGGTALSLLNQGAFNQTDSSVRQLVNQNTGSSSILSIHAADGNIRVHLERAQGEKGQNLKRTARANLFSLLEDALDRVCNSSNNQVFFGWNWKQICRLMQYVCKYVCCQGSSVVLSMR